MLQKRVWILLQMFWPPHIVWQRLRRQTKDTVHNTSHVHVDIYMYYLCKDILHNIIYIYVCLSHGCTALLWYTVLASKSETRFAHCKSWLWDSKQSDWSIVMSSWWEHHLYKQCTWWHPFSSRGIQLYQWSKFRAGHKCQYVTMGTIFTNALHRHWGWGVGALRKSDDTNFLKPNGQSSNLNIYDPLSDIPQYVGESAVPQNQASEVQLSH